MVSYLLEWVKLLYFLNTFYFPAPSRSHLQLCFCGMQPISSNKQKKRVAFSFVAYTWASGVLVCLNIIHSNSGLPLTFCIGQSKLIQIRHSQLPGCLCKDIIQTWVRSIMMILKSASIIQECFASQSSIPQYKRKKSLQARFQQYVNHELPDIQAGFTKCRGTRDQMVNVHWITEKQESSRKTSTLLH